MVAYDTDREGNQYGGLTYVPLVLAEFALYEIGERRVYKELGRLRPMSLRVGQPGRSADEVSSSVAVP